MRKIFNLLCFLVVLFAGNCFALTIFQEWNVNNWTKVIGSGADISTVIEPLPNGVHCLYTDLYRNRNDKGIATIYTYLGAAAIPAGTTAGNVPEFWMECDFIYLGGGTKYCTMFGIFNSAGDNDNNPAINITGIQIGGSNVQALVEDNTSSSASDTIYGAGSNITYRVKSHVYNSGGRTLMDVYVYRIDDITFEETYIGSVIGYVVLDTGESFNRGMNVFGVRNTIYSAGSPPAHNQIEFDNMYFSNEEPKPVTIFKTWDTCDNNNWTITIGTNASDTEIEPMPTGEHCLYTDVYRNQSDNGMAAIYTTLGTASIPAGTEAGDVPEFWLDYDFVYLGGNTAFATMLGIFNSDGDNDNEPPINAIGIQMGGSDIQAVAGNFTGSVSDTIYGAGSNITHRVKSHVYNSGGRTLMDVYVYRIDDITFEETYTGSVIGYVVLDIGELFDQGMDVLGVRNTAYSTIRHNMIRFDNIYFSTEGPNENQMIAEPVGLAGRWCFDSPSNLAMDYSGNGNDGQIVGNCSHTYDAYAGGGAIQFNGGYVRLYSCLNNGFIAKFSGGRATLAVWLKLDSANPTWPDNGFANMGAWCYPSVYPSSADTLSLKLFLSDGAPVIVSLPPAAVLTQWHHLAVSVDSHNTESGYKVYFDGALAGEFPMDGTHGNFLSADKPLIGASFNVAENAWSYMYGTIDELYIYNRALAASEVRSLTHFSDFDYSGRVDYTDFLWLVDKWLSDCYAPDWCAGIDINRNSRVDFIDFAYFTEQWLQQVP